MLQRYIKKVLLSTYGKLYQFLKLGPITDEENTVYPFEIGVFSEVIQEELPKILIITSERGVDASGFYRGGKFVVQKGSKFAASTFSKCLKKYGKLREGLILEGILISLHQQLFLLEDVEFDSLGAAMGTVIGSWGKVRIIGKKR